MFYSEVVKSNFDAGVYREYIVKEHASVLIFGGTYNSYRMAIAHCNKLSRITKIPVNQIIGDVKNDYEVMNEING